MDRISLQSWRSISMEQIRSGTAILVLTGLTLVAVTRLTVLQGDIVVAAGMDGQGNILRQVLYLIGAALMLPVSRPLTNPGKLVDLPVSLLLLVALCVISLGWSETPGVAVRRLVLAIMVIWLAFRTVDELGYRTSLNVVLHVLVCLLVANLLAVAVTPLAVHHAGGELQDSSVVGAWRGVLADKNAAGLATAITLMLVLFGAGRFPLAARFVIFAAGSIFLAGTQSKTSMGLIPLPALIGAMFRIFNPRYRALLVPLLVIAASAAVLAAAVYLPAYLDRLASSPDAFTGRIDIWRPLVAYCRDHFWLGAGYGSFWNVGPIGPINEYTNKRWIIVLMTTAHNGYLDVATQIGVPGMILAVIVLFAVPIAKLVSSTTVPRTYGALALALLVFMMAHNMTESSMLAPDPFGEFVLILTIACVENMRRSTVAVQTRSRSEPDVRVSRRARLAAPPAATRPAAAMRWRR